MKQKVVAGVLVLAELGVFGSILWLQPLATSLSMDFITFYSAGRIIRRGDAPRLYDFETQLADQREFSGHDEPMLYFHPPFEALVFVPFAYLPYRVAYTLWGLLNLVVFGATLWLLREYLARLDTEKRLAVTALTFLPAYATLLRGQDDFLLLLLVSCAFLALKGGKDGKAGALLGLGLFRFQFVLPILLVLVIARARRWPIIAGAGVVALVYGAYSVLLIGPAGCFRYAEMLYRTTERSRESHRVAASSMVNFRGLAALSIGDRLGSKLTAVLVILISIAILVWCSRRWRRLEIEAAFSMTVIVCIIASFYSWVTDLALLLLPGVLLAAFRAIRLDTVLMAALFVQEFALIAWQSKAFSILVPTLLLWAATLLVASVSDRLRPRPCEPVSGLEAVSAVSPTPTQ